MAGAKVPLTFRIFKGDQLLREERLSLSVIKLGKVPSAHLKLDDETVSRMHAIIEVNGPGDVSIIDLGSTKGTFVNGQKVNKAKLQSGDTIVVGETRIELAIGASEEEEVTKVSTQAAPEVISSTPRPAVPAPTMQSSVPPPAPPRPPAPPSFATSTAVAPPAPQAFAPGPAPAAPMAAASAPAPSAPSLRPPPGMPGGPSIYGAPMAVPQGFQASMAESADDLTGARAVEVAAMLGDSVVGVKHCMDPRGGSIKTGTWLIFAAAIIAFLLSAGAFTLGVKTAAYNKGRYDYETQKLGKPGYAVRPVILPQALDWIAFGGLAFSISFFAWSLARMRSERRSPWFRIGNAPGVEFATEGAGPVFPLVEPRGDDFAFNFSPGMEGEMITNGQSTSLAELASQGRTSIMPIPPNSKIRVRIGKTTFLVSAVPRPRSTTGALFASFEARVLAYFGGSLAAHLILLFIVKQAYIDDSGVNVDLASLEDNSLRSASASQDDPPPPEEEDKPDDGADESGGTGTAMALEEGKMGKKDSDRAEGQYKMQKNQEDPQLARQQAIEQARTAGILGSTALTQGGAFASLTGTGDISSGFDDTNIYGGLLGNEAGEMNGGFGYGRSGFGPGGGGTGWGTIGTGRYGTIGHGSGTGSGYGVGGGRGGMRGRSSAVPTVSIGQPNAQGDLDKAIIRRYIKRNIQKIQYCYEKELLAKSNLAGTVQTQFFITPNGNVATASGSGVDPEVANCVANVIKGIEFPKPKGGGGVQVNYPFTFRPAGS
ncbi:MAG TPA: AgmX/PglI C-terminal domain-containing protein [Kofleriaceae bacterium]|nr:AgmX/PglI C-terminal domain-containing protein [Kofleriaceae bacterium]